MSSRAPRPYIPHNRRGLIIALAVAITLVTAAAFAYLAVIARTTPDVRKALSGLTDSPSAKLPSFAVEAMGDVYDSDGSSLSPTYPPSTPPATPQVKRPVIEYPVERLAVAKAERKAKPSKRSERVAPSAPSKAAPSAPSVPTDDMTWRPARADVQAALDGLALDVQHCYDVGMVPGQVEVTITVQGESGAVSDVSVKPKTSTSSCVARVVGQLQLAPFAQPQITITKVYLFK